eukprot:Nk52_evm4s683 gene=Nk52_evmTU4s683
MAVDQTAADGGRRGGSSPDPATPLLRKKTTVTQVISHLLRFTTGLCVDQEELIHNGSDPNYSCNANLKEQEKKTKRKERKGRLGDQTVHLIDENLNWSEEARALREFSTKATKQISQDEIAAFLKSFSLIDCKITDLDPGIRCFENVTKLSLSANYLTRVPGYWLPRHLQVLQLYSNSLSDLNQLSRGAPSTIVHLGLGYNNIKTLKNQIKASKWPNLLSLDLSENELDDLGGAVEIISTLPKLRCVNFKGNPFTLWPWYKGFVIVSLPRLSILDELAVTEEDRYALKPYELGQISFANTMGIRIGAKSVDNIPPPFQENEMDGGGGTECSSRVNSDGSIEEVTFHLEFDFLSESCLEGENHLCVGVGSFQTKASMWEKSFPIECCDPIRLTGVIELKNFLQNPLELRLFKKCTTYAFMDTSQSMELKESNAKEEHNDKANKKKEKGNKKEDGKSKGKDKGGKVQHAKGGKEEKKGDKGSRPGSASKREGEDSDKCKIPVSVEKTELGSLSVSLKDLLSQRSLVIPSQTLSPPVNSVENQDLLDSEQKESNSEGNSNTLPKVELQIEIMPPDKVHEEF